ncbi:MAG: lytic transglycosylase domain-containing protein [Bacteriovoracaceae bacterium]|nr:lytic transglycosylase domain-containing protein [Bacteriovoracaceae bacterium]
MYLKAISTFILCITTCFASPKISKNIQKSLFNFNNSSNDKKLAREINSYTRFLKSYRYKSLNINNIKFYLNKTSAFKELKDVINWSMKVIKLNTNSANFYQLCAREKSMSQFENKLIDLTILFCNHKFLKKISSHKNRFSSQQLTHLSKNLSTLLLKETRPLFSLFLNRIKKGSVNFYRVSNHINNYYVENYQSPAGKILQSININDELTTYIQNNGIDLHTSKKFFTQEFNTLIKQTRAEIKKRNLYQAKTMFSQALAFFHQNKQYISPVHAWRNFLYTTQDFSRLKEFQIAHESYKQILQVCTYEQKDKTLFNMLINSIRSNNIPMLQLTLNSFSYLDSFSKHSIKLRFWIARALEKTGDKKTSMYLYKKIANSSSLQYYSVLSSRKISRNTNIKNIHKLLPKREIANIQQSILKKKYLSIPFQQKLKRIALWVDLQMDGLIELESQDILKLSAKQVFKSEQFSRQFGKIQFQRLMFKELINMYNEKGKYLQTFKLVYKAIESQTYDINDKSLKVLFPFRYLKKIERYSKTIDPLLILALIRQESAFNPNAKSHAGAQGLMQLMPATARRYKRRLKAYQLKDPSLNLRIGIKYLKKLLKKYDGNLIQTLAAYNAGEGRVKRWMKNVFIHKDPLLAIESIPFKETRNYVKFIYRNIYFYKFLTNSLNLGTPLKETFKVII